MREDVCCPSGRLYPFPHPIMEERRTIGLSELLDEIDRDLDDFRRKHQGDYSVKNITLWWQMQRERLTIRHSPSCAVKLHLASGWKRTAIWFLVGATLAQTLNLMTRLWP